jgi:hypothetical protein
MTRASKLSGVGGGDDAVSCIQLAARWEEPFAPAVAGVGRQNLGRAEAACSYIWCKPFSTGRHPRIGPAVRLRGPAGRLRGGRAAGGLLGGTGAASPQPRWESAPQRYPLSHRAHAGAPRANRPCVFGPPAEPKARRPRGHAALDPFLSRQIWHLWQECLATPATTAASCRRDHRGANPETRQPRRARQRNDPSG